MGNSVFILKQLPFVDMKKIPNLFNFDTIFPNWMGISAIPILYKKYAEFISIFRISPTPNFVPGTWDL